MSINVMKNLLEVCLFTLYLVYMTECGFFSKAIDKIKNKAKAAYKKKFGKGTTLNFWGHEQAEYPGANNKFREENRAKWNEYYDCLNAQKNNLNTQKTVTPEAIIGFETSFVIMECKICLSPFESQNKESVLWEWAAVEDNAMSPIEFTEHILVSPEDRALHIYNLKNESSGQYMCKLGESVVAPYFLTVVNMSESKMDEVHSPSAPVGPYAKNPEDIKFNLILDTEWGEWSTCSKCNTVGRKHKMGYCNVYWKQQENNVKSNVQENSAKDNLQESKGYNSLQQNNVEDNLQESQENNNSSEKDNESPESEANMSKNRAKRIPENQIENIFKIFKYGIPCQSHILPTLVKELPEVKNRKNEIMSGFCNVKCPEKQVFEIRDKDGKVIERADNSEGIYSLSQKLPPMEPPTERRVQYEEKGKDIVLECPGNVNSDAPLQWQIGEKNLIAEKISTESNGRIYISITERIHINKAKISDSNIYSCWQQKELAGTIRLVVEKTFRLNFNHTIMLLGVVLIVGTFLFVFVKIVANREFTKDE